MFELDLGAGMQPWLDEVRVSVADKSPELLSLFDTYSAEAAFGWSYIHQDIEKLRPHARILEVGAGALLLSCQLKRQGFDVTALEPTGEGFSHFSSLRQIVLRHARATDCVPSLLEFPAESLVENERFDYAFSINVMEHVADVPRVLERVGASLAPGAIYRFTCANYLFPYEPHFNIPTLISKQLTERVLRKRIFRSGAMPDPVGTWASLNWIDVLQVARSVRQLTGLSVRFNRHMLAAMLERLTVDPEFAARRSPLMRRLIAILVKSRVHRLFHLLPASMQPMMDCCIRKSAAPARR